MDHGGDEGDVDHVGEVSGLFQVVETSLKGVVW